MKKINNKIKEIEKGNNLVRIREKHFKNLRDTIPKGDHSGLYHKKYVDFFIKELQEELKDLSRESQYFTKECEVVTLVDLNKAFKKVMGEMK